jgi:hypothetical protein
MDAIGSLLAGTQRAEVAFNGAAQQIAHSDLPSAIVPDPTNPSRPQPVVNNNIDPAQQLTTLMIAADTHHLTTAAMRVAFSMYQDSVNLLNQQNAQS